MAQPTAAKLMEARAMRGNQIAQMEGQVRRISDGEYEVHSQNSDIWYRVFATERGLQCSCPDFAFRGGLTYNQPDTHHPFKCKHIFAVELSHALRQTVESQVKIEPVGIQTCLYCASNDIIRRGIRHNQNGDIQRFLCKSCGKRFTKNLGFEGVKATPQIVTSALQLYFTGESLRNTQKFLALQGVQVSHQTIWNWIQKYVGLMGRYLDQIQPNLSPTWRADELYVKVKGDMKYLFSMMDDQTRFLIAQEVADSKDRHDARGLFHRSAEIAGKSPNLLITDGLASYHLAWKSEYMTNHGHGGPIHVKEIRLAGKIHNNKMERLNGEVRDREKTFRGLKSVDSPILKGYQIFHNYIRPHEGLGGETPADRCGIQVEGSNKWLTIIQNAARVPRLDSETKKEEVP
jgi:transposase-like protein